MQTGRSYAINSPLSVELLSTLGVLAVDVVSVSSQHSLEELRKLISLAYQSPYGEKRLFWVEGAHKLSELAQNTLLKLVEEPGDKLIVIFQTDSLDAFLPTLRSRIHYSKSVLSEESPGQDINVNDLTKLKDRSEIIDALTQLLSNERQKFFQAPSLSGSSAIENINQSITRLKSNANIKVVLDSLILRLVQ